MSGNDLRPILEDWPYEPGQITVRKIVADDGSVKIQMRVDLGLLQMEPVGRPDGRRPKDCESLLHYHRARLEDYKKRNGTDLGFELTEEECSDLRDEAILYYQRYLALFVLEDFAAVERDTARNIEVLDLCRRYAAEQSDRVVLEQYRPYITMMNARAKAHQALEAGRIRSGLAAIEAGLRTIAEFFESLAQPEAFEKCGEAAVLREMRRQIVSKLSVDPIQKLQAQLDSAVKEERYEDAARLRDKIAALQQRNAEGQ